MNEIEWLKSLDRAGVPTPARDLTAVVMEAVRARSAGREDERIFRIGACLATIVGIVAVAIIAPTWFGPADPFAGFGEALNLVLR